MCTRKPFCGLESPVKVVQNPSSIFFFYMRSFLFNEWSFKGAVRTNPKFLSASIHDFHFLVADGFLALIASKDAFDRTHKNIVFMEGFNVCLCPPALITALKKLENKNFLKI
jgi:hypothetical protein